MMSQIPCKQSNRLKIIGWIKRYYTGRIKKSGSQIFFEIHNYKIQQDDTLKEV